ncbi:hypothetical protein JAAARDRAFT_58630 [Jaapia argillacea MUCL 33604]|uniref:RTA1-domain-containing protein n=1 Tax=Jaapia argillacea MUCL 33604 TaxID=933084 RepID=A0A067PTI8_9AGAM|nr:hypothetical protein JAAARDRAFT_58630 [Jaapia argillacea MUCL 33604]
MGKCLDPHNPNAEYLYCASTGAAIVFSVLFGLSTACHIIQAIIYRKKFCWIIIMAGIWETGGFVTRVLSTFNQSQIVFVFPSQILILLAPLWINAFDYVLLGRMVHYFLPQQSIAGIRARRLATLFVLLDITALLVQGGGGSMLNNTDSKLVLLGLHIYMGGIGLQEFFILTFVILAIRFQKKATIAGDVLARPTDWRQLLYVLYATLGLITIRIIYRLVGFSQGIYNTLTEHEAFFYCLEAVPMFSALLLYNVWHPGRVLVGPDSEFPPKPKKKKKDGKNAKKTKKDEKLGKPEVEREDTIEMRLVPVEEL